jgi:hypothetical protein
MDQLSRVVRHIFWRRRFRFLHHYAGIIGCRPTRTASRSAFAGMLPLTQAHALVQQNSRRGERPARRRKRPMEDIGLNE